MTHRESWAAVKQRLLSSGKTDFASLVKLAGLDPARHMRFAEWSGADFSGSILRGFDFTGARLIGCNFKGAWIKGARFDQALIDEVRPGTKLDPDRTNLQAAEDWKSYAKGWKRAHRRAPEHLPPGAVFQDAPFAPKMVVIPPGRFMMGSKDNEGEVSERPQHEVTIPHAFAVGRFPVTVEEWNAAFAALNPHLDILGLGRRPVSDVSWHDAQAYVAWLSGKTGKIYRLLSEAEWEYACRSGTETAYYFGESISTAHAQFAEGSHGSSVSTAGVGSFAANNFGLYDMHGNVWEWCEDCWQDSYADKPGRLKQSGGAWTTGDGRFRVLRGGSWCDGPRYLRSAERLGSHSGNRGRHSGNHIDSGFRVARTILTS